MQAQGKRKECAPARKQGRRKSAREKDVKRTAFEALAALTQAHSLAPAARSEGKPPRSPGPVALGTLLACLASATAAARKESEETLPHDSEKPWKRRTDLAGQRGMRCQTEIHFAHEVHETKFTNRKKVQFDALLVRKKVCLEQAAFN